MLGNDNITITEGDAAQRVCREMRLNREVGRNFSVRIRTFEEGGGASKSFQLGNWFNGDEG